MCGLVGVLRWDGRGVDPRRLKEGARALRSRGPDDEGYLLADERGGTAQPFGGPDTPAELNLTGLPEQPGPWTLGIGFRRLAILDLSTAGHQPMASADGRFWIAFNGEVYNYVELRDELEKVGHTFRSSCDTEVVLASWEHWGPRCLERFIGMWAFALWDRQSRELHLVRDPFGVKPLFYRADSFGVDFGSEIKALLAIDDKPRRAHAGALFDYLRFGHTDHREATLFEGIHHLGPGQRLQIRTDKSGPLEPIQYWHLSIDEEPRSSEEAAAALREAFLDSVRMHLRSDVPIGTALSGGIDSSALVCAMRELEGSMFPIRTFSHVAETDTESEERWVDIVATATGARAKKVCPNADELLDDLSELIRAQDEPFGSTSIYAQYRVMRLARESGVAVMLDGQGSDELFGGYPTFIATRLASLIRSGSLLAALRLLLSAWSLPRFGPRQLLPRAARFFLPDALEAPARRLSDEPLFPGWMNDAWFRQQGVQPSVSQPHGRRRLLHDHLRLSFQTTSLPALLRYEDRNSMAHSIESRVPFLTPAIARLAFSLPESLVIDESGTSKAILRHALRDLVPDVVLERRDKLGFVTDERRWIERLSPAFKSMMSGEGPAPHLPVFSYSRLRKEWEGVLDGARPFDFRIWRCINLILWSELYEVDFPA
jgi:asparagine synthase (glutamine-hydrolysing)